MISRTLAITAGAFVCSCSTYTPTYPSPTPFVVPVPSAFLVAGFGRADITPPPGLSMGGYGPEGHVALGHRTRLHARAMYLQDADGQRIAIAVTELDFMAAHVQRLVAARVREHTGIDVDRLLIMATHTHSGPAHFQDAEQMNVFAGTLVGYDPRMVDLLVHGIGDAIIQAYDAREEARAAWGSMNVWGLTRNRSLESYRRNPPDPWPESLAPESLPPEQRAVDPTWLMLRVDTKSSTGTFEPAGAFSVFAIHGTTNPNVDSLYDADIQGLVSASVERRLDDMAGRPRSYSPHAVHIMANGTEGDVSPNWPAESRACHPPRLRPGRATPGPRGPNPVPEYVGARPDEIQACIGAARHFAALAADSLSRMAVQLFESLGVSLSPSVRIDRAFRAVSLVGGLQPVGLCPQGPEVGVPFAAGGTDGVTRLDHFKLLGVFDLGFHQGAVSHRVRGCQSPKVELLGPLQNVLVSSGGLPGFGQFSVVHIGGVLLVTLPIEVTTRSGLLIRRMIEDSLRAHGLAAERIAIVSLTNGYLQYLATPSEYSEQRYEGAATIYGPASAIAYGGILGALAAQPLRRSDDSLLNPVPPLTISPGRPRHVAPESWGDPPAAGIQRVIRRACWRADSLIVEWLDQRPGQLLPNEGPIVRFEVWEAGQWRIAAWDDNRDVEVFVLGAASGGGSWWRVKWIVAPSDGQARVTLVGRDMIPELAVEVRDVDRCGPRSPRAGDRGGG